MKKLLNLLLVMSISLSFGCISLTDSDAVTIKNDLTSKIEELGQPFKYSEYPRNVWDMQVYGDRIYLGSGNSSNKGPATNAGPVPVIYYDTVNSSFHTIATIPEEQIDVFRIIDNKLVIPGHDSKESWSFGNFFTIEKDTYTKFRTIKDGVHVYDMGYLNGNMFAATGTAGFGAAMMSGDMGKTWVSLNPKDNYRFYAAGGRAFSTFQFKNKMYFTSILFSGRSYYNNFLCVDSTANVETAGTGVTDEGENGVSIIKISNMMPGSPKNTVMRMVRTTEVGDKLIYISAFPNNDHQWLPNALYVATAINKSKRVSLPEPDALPMDIISRDKTAYVLAYVKTDTEKYTNIVYKSEDLYSWSECFRFESDTFARSFEQLNDDFYFGLGCHTDYLSKSTGKILRIHAPLDK